MLAKQLKNKISKIIMNTGKEPNVIIMHPTACHNLFEDFMKDFNLSEEEKKIIKYSNEFKFFGIKIFRSFDVKLGEFEVF